MTNLTGRELDHCVADILGRSPSAMVELTKPGSPTHTRAVDIATPRYSTDPATQAEKLAWLMRFGRVEINVVRDFAGIGVDARLEGFGDGFWEMDVTKGGSTIDEALARLVCAVEKELSK